MHRELRDLVRQQDLSESSDLPLMHTTKSKIVPEILASKKLNLLLDGRAGSTPVFLFFGRPAYRSHRKPGEPRSHLLTPTCFILRSGAPIDPFQLFPFDTGAYELYKKACPEILPLEKFELYSSRKDASKFIILFFGDPVTYISGHFDGTNPGDPFREPCLAASQYLELRSKMPMAEYDDRVFTIEFQCNTSVALDRNTVEAVIIPKRSCDVLVGGKSIEKIIKDDWGASLLAYSTFLGLEPTEYHAKIMELAVGYVEGRLQDNAA